MNSTSPDCRSVRRAARSPVRTSAGPEVIRNPTPISAATMPANEVLPRPGGPTNSRWSTAWPRLRAASITIWRCSVSSAWPTNSSRRLGRSRASSACSAGSASGSTDRRTAPSGTSDSSVSPVFLCLRRQVGLLRDTGVDHLAARAHLRLPTAASSRRAPRSRSSTEPFSGTASRARQISSGP